MEPTSGKTIRLEEHYKLSNERAEEVIAASRKNYAKNYQESKLEDETKKLTVRATVKKATTKKPRAKTAPVVKFKGRSIGR